MSYGHLKVTDIYTALPRQQTTSLDFGRCIIKDLGSYIHEGSKLH